MSLSSISNLILASGFLVLISSFYLFGGDLNVSRGVASQDSESSLNDYQRCFIEICGKPVEEFAKSRVNDKPLIDENLEKVFSKFLVEYQKYEIELQRLVKKKAKLVADGKLSGEADFTLPNLRDIVSYFEAIARSFDGKGDFSKYLKEVFPDQAGRILRHYSHLVSWAEQEFLFSQIIEAQKLYRRSNLEEHLKQMYPNLPSFRSRLTFISREIVDEKLGLDWLHGYDLKKDTWPSEFFLNKGFYDEYHFLDELKGHYYLKMLKLVVEKPSTAKKIKEQFQFFTEAPEFGMIFDEGVVYDIFTDFDSMCRSTVEEELFWASSSLRNRVIERHFVKLKTASKSLFDFKGQSVAKTEFELQVDQLELLKDRSIQEARAFYPFYFQKVLEAQKKSIKLLNEGSFKEIVLFLNAYLSSIQPFYPEGESRDERRDEDYAYVKKLSLVNQACKAPGIFDVDLGSYFSPYDRHMYLERKGMRFFQEGIVTLAHEIGHGISTILKSDKNDFLSKMRTSVWDKRDCIDQYYLDEYREDEGQESMQTEEDWADYFAVKLVAKLKEDASYSWAHERFECSFVHPYEISEDDPKNLKPAEFLFTDEHSSSLFRMMAMGLYSKGSLGPICKNLAEEETRLLKTCPKK